MEIIVLFVVLIILGVWTKQRNTLHMRSLAFDQWKKNGGPMPSYIKKQREKNHVNP